MNAPRWLVPLSLMINVVVLTVAALRLTSTPDRVALDGATVAVTEDGSELELERAGYRARLSVDAHGAHLAISYGDTEDVLLTLREDGASLGLHGPGGHVLITSDRDQRAIELASAESGSVRIASTSAGAEIRLEDDGVVALLAGAEGSRLVLSHDASRLELRSAVDGTSLELARAAPDARVWSPDTRLTLRTDRGQATISAEGPHGKVTWPAATP